jgi:NAD(P)-dependent dehydrogenase (short-subunit alcohol dehydrogenase family)
MTTTLPLEGRVALITGGRRIGVVVARELARLGADVALAYRRSLEEAEMTAASVRDLGRRASVLQADVRRPEDCTRLVAGAEADLGGLDILVNMASTYVERPLATIGEDDWRADIDANLSSVFYCSTAAIPALRRRSGGHIVNFTDWLPASGRPAYTGYVPYYVAKAGVKALTEALALELAAENILVNAIAPGPIVAPPDMPEDERQEATRNTPLGRWGGEMAVAQAVTLLVTTTFITGETIRVDGGRHVK